MDSWLSKFETWLATNLAAPIASGPAAGVSAAVIGWTGEASTAITGQQPNAPLVIHDQPGNWSDYIPSVLAVAVIVALIWAAVKIAHEL